MGLSNPACTTTACEWPPKSKLVRNVKLKDLKLSRGDFGRRGRKLPELNCSPKKKFYVTQDMDGKLCFEGVANAMREVCSKGESIIFTAETKECLPNNSIKSTYSKVKTISNFIAESNSPEEFLKNMEYFPHQLAEIEQETRG